MFRPNRIGEHPIIDTSAIPFVILQSTANYTTNLGDRDDFFVQTDTTSVGEEISTTSFTTPLTDRALALTDTKSWSFGRFVNGLALNDKPMMVSYHVEVTCRLASASSSFELAAYIGRKADATVVVDITAQNNNMRTWYKLDAKGGAVNETIFALSAKGTIVDTIENGGLSGVFDTDPIGVFFAAIAHDGTNTIQWMAGSISIYRYAKDVKTFDPNR